MRRSRDRVPGRSASPPFGRRHRGIEKIERVEVRIRCGGNSAPARIVEDSRGDLIDGHVSMNLVGDRSEQGA